MRENLSRTILCADGSVRSPAVDVARWSPVLVQMCAHPRQMWHRGATRRCLQLLGWRPRIVGRPRRAGPCLLRRRAPSRHVLRAPRAPPSEVDPSLVRSFRAPSSLHAAALTAACAVAVATVQKRLRHPPGVSGCAASARARQPRKAPTRLAATASHGRRSPPTTRSGALPYANRRVPYASTHAPVSRPALVACAMACAWRTMSDGSDRVPIAAAGASTCTSSRGPCSPSCLRSTNSRQSRQRAPAPLLRCWWR